MYKSALGWLAPDGSFFPCNWADHVFIAEDICKKYGFNDLGKTADDTIMAHGFVHITQSAWDCEYHLFWDKHLTTIQKDFLKAYYHNKDITISYACLKAWQYETGENLITERFDEDGFLC